MNKELEQIFKIYIELFKSTLLYYARKYVNTKTNTDTLSNSDIIKDMKLNVEDGRLSISIYNYWTNIEQGSPVGTIVPHSELIKWVKKKKINNNLSVNTFAKLAARSIKLKGISKRPIFSLAYDSTSKYIDEELNKYVDKITDQILIKNLKKK